MLIFFGVRDYGKTDHVPGLFYTCARFFHIWFVPLIPVGGVLRLDRADMKSHGVRIGPSAMSVLLPWVRVILFVATAFLGLLGLSSMAQAHTRLFGLMCFAAAAICITGFVLSYILKGIHKPSYERAVELAHRLQMPPDVFIGLDMVYGKISKEEAHELIRESRAAEAAALRAYATELLASTDPANQQPLPEGRGAAILGS